MPFAATHRRSEDKIATVLLPLPAPADPQEAVVVKKSLALSEQPARQSRISIHQLDDRPRDDTPGVRPGAFVDFGFWRSHGVRFRSTRTR